METFPKWILCASDLTKPGLFTMRLKTPASFVIPPHWHSKVETVTVLSGKLNIGEGDKSTGVIHRRRLL